MKLELQSASNFLVHLIKLGRRNINENQLEKFRLALVEVLRRRYRDHWFPEKPFKGSGYRCIRINGKMDPVIAQAGESCGLSAALVHSTFPSELTMWIDPLEVSYRIGENGSICVLYEYKEGVNEPWKPNVSIGCSDKAANKAKKDSKSKAFSSSSSSAASSSASSTGSVSPPPQPTAPTNATATTKATTVAAAAAAAATVPCKDSLRKMDYLLDPRKSVSIEQLAAYVSS